MDCGREGFVNVEKNKPIKCGQGFHYWGKLNANAYKTDEHIYEVISTKPYKTKKIKNPFYNPKIKEKIVRLWLCDDCQKISDEQEIKCSKKTRKKNQKN